MKKYDVTSKLKFSEDPVLVIQDKELTIKSDAETILRLMDILAEKGEMSGAREALGLLLSEKDQKKLAALHLKMDDYLEVMTAAVSLAIGDGPEKAEYPE